MQGRSVLPLVRREPVEWPEEVLVQISESQVGRAIRTGRWKYGVTAPDLDGWSESHAESYVEELLYDLQADPYELTNLAGWDSYRSVADELQRKLISRMAEAGEPVPEIVPAQSKPAGKRRVSIEELRLKL
ncbi:hypothetical protein N6H14_32345 [Paenibacillus sp. CC-CFT747]|nr:hypothetical protein N6H14_32345 [Paenibacillus sp. CC-CFT747]